MISTEQLLTSADGFGIATATPAQRAACYVLDGSPMPGYLRTHPDVAALVGGQAALDALPSERGVLPTEVVFLASVRSAKTIIACAAAIRMSQTVDVSRLGPGEVPRVSLVSLRLDQAQVARRILADTIQASKVLRRLRVSDDGESVTLKHPSGRHVEIAVVAGSKAGGSLVSRWSAGVVFDEAPRMSSAADAVVNLGDARTAILGRLLPGAQALYIGSPWAPHGDVYDWVGEHWQKPSHGFVVLRGTGPMLNPTWWTPERCAELEARNPTAYACDVLGDFADPEAGLLNPAAVMRSVRQGPLELPPSSGAYFAAVDPSEGGAGGNGFTLALVQRVNGGPGMGLPAAMRYTLGIRPNPAETRYRVALVREFRGLSPDACWQAIAAALKPYRVRVVVTDQYAASANRDLARLRGLEVVVRKATAATKLEDWTNFAVVLHQDKVELAPDPLLRRDLMSVKRRVTQSGATIVLPRTSDGRHCDLGAALCAALNVALPPDFQEAQPFRVNGLRG